MGSLMSWFLIPILAQAEAAAAEEVSAGQMLSGLMVLSVMAGSLAMMVVWATRIRETGHALPAARRGILRVPAVLTIVAIGLSLLMLLMMGLVSLEDKLVTPVIPPPAGVVAEEAASAGSPESTDNAAASAEAKGGQQSGADPSSGDNPEKADRDDEPRLTPEAMKRALVQTVIMDAFLFLVFGFVVFAASSRGRFYLTETAARVSSAAAGALRDFGGFASNSAWPDLDGRSAVAQQLRPFAVGESTFGNPGADDSPSFLTSTLGASEVGIAGEPDEPFSFWAELRFAGEVFLAAYLPTAILRIIVVLLTVGLMGEEPDQHPFLEMMKSDVGVTVLSLILLTAVFLAPLVEELQFRVVILGGIAQLGYPMIALTVSSMLFALAHGFPDSLALVPLAFALGYTYLRRRSYITVMIVHFLFNGFNMMLALLAML